MISVSIKFHSHNEWPHTEIKSLYLVCSPPFQKEGNPNFEIFKKGVGEPEKIFWVGESKGGGIFKNKGRVTHFFKLNLGIVKNKKEDF